MPILKSRKKLFFLLFFSRGFNFGTAYRWIFHDDLISRICKNSRKLQKVQFASTLGMYAWKHNCRSNFEIGYSRKVLFLHFLWYLKFFYKSHEIRLLQTRTHAGLCQASKMGLLAKIFIDLKFLTFLKKDFHVRYLTVS